MTLSSSHTAIAGLARIHTAPCLSLSRCLPLSLPLFPSLSLAPSLPLFRFLSLSLSLYLSLFPSPSLPLPPPLCPSLTLPSFGHEQKLERLLTLSASHNDIKELDGKFSRLGALQTLNLASNKLKDLPLEMGDMTAKVHTR